MLMVVLIRISGLSPDDILDKTFRLNKVEFYQQIENGNFMWIIDIIIVNCLIIFKVIFG